MDFHVEVHNHNQEENNFCRLFQVILDSIINLKQLPERDVEIAIQSIKKLFNYCRFANVSRYDTLCGYLFRYGSHGAGLTRRRVLEAFENCQIFASESKKSNLTVISLGGGPGNDVIGFCSALFETQLRCRTSLDITVVDAVKEWSLCVNLGNIFLMEDNFGNASELFHQNDVKMSFLQTALPGNPVTDEKYFQILSKADVILMTKLVSVMEWNAVKKHLENLSTYVKKEAFILYIDSPFEEEVMKFFDVLYLSEEDNYYMSSALNERFNSDDKVKSKARIAVLRKKCL